MEDLIIEFANLHIAFLRSLNNSGVTYEEYEKLMNKINQTNGTLTYGEILDKYRHKTKDANVMKMIVDLDNKIDVIRDLRMGGIHVSGLTSIEYMLQSIFYRYLYYNLISLRPLKIASDLTGIPVTSIKQACQQGRLKKALKANGSWKVDVSEVKEYWSDKIK